MDLFRIGTYLFSGSICLSMAIMLLTVRLGSSFQDRDYQRIKRFLAYSALIDVAVDIIAISLTVHEQNIFILDSFVVPVAYYAQLYLMCKAILGLIHSPESRYPRLFTQILPIAILIVLYIGGYLYHSAPYPLFSEAGYTAFADTLWAKSLSGILYFVICAEFVAFLIILILETRRYLDKLKNFYSGMEVIDGQRLSAIVWCFLGYFILAGCDFMFSSEQLDPIFMIVNTCIFIILAMFIINLQSVYLSVQQVEHYNSPETEETEKESAYTLEENETGIMNAVHKWENRADKPYLKGGIVVADVADSLGITDVQLSFVLNHSMNLNFCSWINKLRIEEAKRMIEGHPQMSITEVASASGFSDLNTFTRNFKKMTKMTPVAYRKKDCHA